MTTDKQAEIDRCWLCYEKLTGFRLNRRGVCDHRIRAWYDWLEAGGTVKDLEMVILWLKSKIAHDGWPNSMLNFSYLVERPDRFEQWREQCKAEQRNKRPAPTPKETVQQQFSPTAGPEPAKDKVRHISEVIAAMREASK